MFHVTGSDFVTSLPRNYENSWRIYHEKWEFVTFMSRKIRISWLLCHEKWRFRDLSVTKNGDCVTYLSWKMGIRDFYVTKNEDFMTSISREFGILWRMCHETNSSSYETVRFCDILVMKLDTLMEFNEKSLFYFIKYVLGDQWLL